MKVEAHFVTFFSPCTLVAETTKKPIPSWDPEIAKRMAAAIKERYGAVPYGFRFTTRSREDHELDSKVIAESPLYFLGGKVETLEMECNGYKRIITNTNSWRWTQPLSDSDVVLQWP